MTSVELLSPFSILGNQPVPVGTTLAEVHARHASHMPTVVVLNGKPLMRAEWHTVVKEGDELALMVVPGKGGFKQILSVVALLVIAVVAPQIGLAIAGSAGLGANLIAAGVVLAGSLLVNALLAPSNKAKDASGELDTTGSPTYNLQSQGNQARLNQVIPRLYGRHILVPDYAAKPYTYYENNDAYLCQLFCLGVGKYQLEEIRIDKSTLWKDGQLTDSYTQVEVVKYEPNEYVGNLIEEVETSAEVSGQEVKRIQSTPEVANLSGRRITYTGGVTPADDIKADSRNYLGNFEIGSTIALLGTGNNDGDYLVTNVDTEEGLWVEVQKNFVTEGSFSNITIVDIGLLGPYVVNPANTIIDKIEIDIIWPEGIWSVANVDNKAQYSYYTESVELQYRKIDSLGLPVSDWTTKNGNNGLRFKYNNFDQRRETRSFDVEPGRYEARFRRLNINRHYPAYHNKLQWSGLKGYYVASNRYKDVTLLGVKIKADNQITSQTSRRFKTIQTAMLPVFNGTSFSQPVATRRISDAFIDACTDKVYGLGRSIRTIDYEALAALEQTWTARGETFDGVFDTKYTAYDAISAILYVGRSKPLLVSGVITAVRDEPRTLSRMVFTPLAGGIKKNSLSIEHVMNDENSPTDAIVSYIDERTWTQNEVECYIDEDDRDNPVRITAFGIVKKAHAWREGIYQVASNKYRRNFATFSTEMDGKMLMPMDKIVVNHDMPKYGQHGELAFMDNGGLRWYSSERFILPTGVAYAGIRMKNGKLWGPVQVNRIVNNFEGIEHYLIDYIKLGLVDSDGQFLFDSDGAQLTEIGPDYVYLLDSDGKYLTELGPEYKYSDKSILEIDAASYAQAEALYGPLIEQVNQSQEDTGDPGAIVFGGSEDYVKPFRVIACSPQSHDDVTVVCCNEDLRVHTAENDYVMPAD